jgi:hypothetical protein
VRGMSSHIGHPSCTLGRNLQRTHNKRMCEACPRTSDTPRARRTPLVHVGHPSCTLGRNPQRTHNKRMCEACPRTSDTRRPRRTPVVHVGHPSSTLARTSDTPRARRTPLVHVGHPSCTLGRNPQRTHNKRMCEACPRTSDTRRALWDAIHRGSTTNVCARHVLARRTPVVHSGTQSAEDPQQTYVRGMSSHVGHPSSTSDTRRPRRTPVVHSRTHVGHPSCTSDTPRPQHRFGILQPIKTH